MCGTLLGWGPSSIKGNGFGMGYHFYNRKFGLIEIYVGLEHLLKKMSIFILLSALFVFRVSRGPPFSVCQLD